ncbi:hypothetical protein ACHAXR_005581, partial [Thalassiosira sp. AJA248-18]
MKSSISSSRQAPRNGGTTNGGIGGATHPPMPSSLSSPPPPPRRYSVLYYKRTNKVHKNRGTTREDGILTIAPPPSFACSLVNAAAADDDDDDAMDDDDDDDDEEEESGSGKFKKQTKKKKYQQFRKKMNNGTHRSKSGVIWSGVNSDLSRKVFDGGVGEDDTLALNGQWECEIVSLLTNSDALVGGRGSSSSFVGQKKIGGGLNGGVAAKSGMMKKGGSALMRKPAAAGLMGGSRTVPRAPLGNLRKNTINPLQSKKVVGLGGGGGVKRTLGSTAAKMQSKAPPAAVAGKMKKDTNGEWYMNKPESDDDDIDETTTTALASRTSKVTVSGLGSARPPLLKSSGGSSNVARAGVVNNASIDNSNDDFPGALGERINVPASVRKVLRPHQREGIAFLWNCVTGVSPGLKKAMTRSVESGKNDLFDDEESEDEGQLGGLKGEVPRGAVLADEMGLGKTLMTIATIFAYHRHLRDRRFIVVCPSSLVSNWSKEFDKWLGKASQPKRVVVRNGAESEGLRNLKSFVPLKPNQSEVLILSYELFRMHVKVIKNAKRIGMLVVDEGHRLKNTSGSQILTALNSIDVEARILITGTPIQNNLSEFFNVANFAVPGILGDLSNFRRLYERPMAAANQKNAPNAKKQKGRQQSKALDAITSTFVLRRLQKDVLKSLLPP